MYNKMILYIKLRNFNSHIKENVYSVYTEKDGKSRRIYTKSYRLGSSIRRVYNVNIYK